MSVLGVGLSGLGWFIPLAAALVALALNRGPFPFPLLLWTPWLLLVGSYLVFAEVDHALQRSVMMVCPIAIGAALSRSRIGDPARDVMVIARTLTVALWVIVLVETGMLLSGTLPEASGLAAVAMTSALLCTIFAADYALGRRRAIVWWALLALIPVVGLTRMGILAAGLSLPLTLAPLRRSSRIASVIVLMVAGIAVFQTDRMQRKMFFSGSGSLEEISGDNPDFAMTGRRGIWDALQAEITNRPWFGHGANASEPFVAFLSGGLTHPHNDWLRLLYDYGYVGAGAFAVTLAAQVLHLLWLARTAGDRSRLLLFASASSFVTFLLFMLTDNVVLYAAFFGNLQFAMIGLAYASDASERGGPT